MAYIWESPPPGGGGALQELLLVRIVNGELPGYIALFASGFVPATVSGIFRPLEDSGTVALGFPSV